MKRFNVRKMLARVCAGALCVAMGAALAACGSSDSGSETTTASSGSETTTKASDGTTASVGGDSTVSGTVSTDGSTSMEEVIGILGEAFSLVYPDAALTYNPTGSGSGITAASEGSCDIGLASRYLKDEEKAEGLTETVLAYDGIAVVVNPSNSVADLTLEQIASIFKGEITDWSEVGGSEGEIVVIGREAGSGTRDGFESITDTEDSCAYVQELTSTGDVKATVASNSLAIGYVSMSALDDTVSAVAVDGVEVSEDTVKDGSYSIQRPFVFVTKEDTALSDVAQAFYDWALSEDASEYISSAGVVPAN